MLIRVSILCLCLVTSCVRGQPHPPLGCLSADEARLGFLINEYRQRKGLPKIGITKDLSSVAQWHILDVKNAINSQGFGSLGRRCNLHSWYGDAPASPNYTSCCYTADHKRAACMWNKPKEITQGRLDVTGFEISGSGYLSVDSVLDGWEKSAIHNELILNKDKWEDFPWASMGVGVDPINRFYFVWFTHDEDRSGKAERCEQK